MKIVDWAKRRLTAHLYPAAERSYPPLIDAEFDGEPHEPTVSVRFKVTTVEVAATADAPKREAATYYVYGQDEAEALARLSADLLLGAKVEVAGHVQDGLLHLPEDERRVQIVENRAAPGTPGPAK
jgi:hypothetical protein